MATLSSPGRALPLLLGTSMQTVLHPLPLSPGMKEALTGDRSIPGLTLELARSLECCGWDQRNRLQHALRLPEGAIGPPCTDALHWAFEMLREAGGGPEPGQAGRVL